MADPENTLVLETTKGRVVIELRPDLAPGHVERIKTLAGQGFYDGVKFHRVIEGFMAQTGCPKGTGTGGSDMPDLKAEFNAEPARARHLLHGPHQHARTPRTRSSSSASTTPASSTASTRCGAR
jgi:cyclophilin family peptidyl-prolyl cis-trans isomerase